MIRIPFEACGDNSVLIMLAYIIILCELNVLSFSFFSLAAAGVRASSTFGVSTSSSSLLSTFAADFLADVFVCLAPFFLVVEISAMGVLGVDNFNLVLVFGVFAGYILV